MQLNAGAFRIAESIIARAAALGVECRTVAGVRVVDCGVKVTGSIAAGLEVSRAALADLGSVRLEPAGTGDDEWAMAAPDCGWPLVAVESGQPLAACLASQYAGWKVSTKGYFAMASGPIRAAIGREDRSARR
jgi:methenyltetrahydromethanopterin cyclohydrolase